MINEKTLKKVKEKFNKYFNRTCGIQFKEPLNRKHYTLKLNLNV